jgi:hypothetical protein
MGQIWYLKFLDFKNPVGVASLRRQTFHERHENRVTNY